jgi:hypothetical protein
MKTKVVFEDDGKDKAIVGDLSDDGYFWKLVDNNGYTHRIRKDRVFYTKQIQEE